jgi:hypothetical protein
MSSLPSAATEAYTILKALRSPNITGLDFTSLPSYELKTGLLRHYGNLLQGSLDVAGHSRIDWIRGAINAMPWDDWAMFEDFLLFADEESEHRTHVVTFQKSDVE